MNPEPYVDVALRYQEYDAYNIYKKEFIHNRKSNIEKFHDEDIDEKFIVINMGNLNDFEPTIQTLRTNFKNGNSFNSYFNVITSHLLSCKDNPQILTKT